MWHEEETIISLLGEVIRTSRLIEENWYVLLESRRLQLSKQFASVTFPVLGSMQCLSGRKYRDTEAGRHTIEADKFEIKDNNERKLLEQRGLYHVGKKTRGECTDRVFVAQDEIVTMFDGIYYLWGLSAQGYWEIVEIHFSEGWLNNVGPYEYAKAVVLQSNVKAKDIVGLGTTPQKMMSDLTKDWKRIVDRREELCKQAVKTYHAMSVEDELLRVC